MMWYFASMLFAQLTHSTFATAAVLLRNAFARKSCQRQGTVESKVESFFRRIRFIYSICSVCVGVSKQT